MALPLFVFFSTLAHAGWTTTGTEGGCTFFAAEPEGDVTPLRAECRWDIPAERLHTLIADFGAHDDYFSAVTESTVTGSSGGAVLVRQRHATTGVADRTCNLVFTTTDLAGGRRYAWTMAKDQSGLGGVIPSRDDGKWEVVADGTGSKVVYELRYGAGGSVPLMLVRWLEGAGFRMLVLEMANFARGA